MFVFSGWISRIAPLAPNFCLRTGRDVGADRRILVKVGLWD